MKSSLFSKMLMPFGSIICITIVTSCSSGSQKKKSGKDADPNVIVHELSDPDMLNPVNYTAADAAYIMNNIFQSPIGIDFKTLQLVPILAVSKPSVEKNQGDKGLNITYEIRPE